MHCLNGDVCIGLKVDRISGSADRRNDHYRLFSKAVPFVLQFDLQHGVT